MYKIMYKYGTLRKEKIDSASSLRAARALLSEYAMAYRGTGARVWIEYKGEEVW